MAVERLTDYTRRIWTALDADAPEGHDFEVGDVIYYMDSSQCGIVTYVYPEGSIDVEFLPDIGGGGGDAVMGTTITTGNQVVIPKVPGYSNFLAYVNGDQAYTEGYGGKHLVSYRISWVFGARIANAKTSGTTWPPGLTYGTMNTSFITETDDMITQNYTNNNTVGLVPAGTEIVYIWF